MKLNKGWLYRQFKRTSEDVQQWPSWMKREAGFNELAVECPRPQDQRQIAPSCSITPISAAIASSRELDATQMPERAVRDS